VQVICEALLRHQTGAIQLAKQARVLVQQLIICCAVAASEDEATPFASPSKRPAVGVNAPPPPPPPRGNSAAQRERKTPRIFAAERTSEASQV